MGYPGLAARSEVDYMGLSHFRADRRKKELRLSVRNSNIERRRIAHKRPDFKTLKSGPGFARFNFLYILGGAGWCTKRKADVEESPNVSNASSLHFMSDSP